MLLDEDAGGERIGGIAGKDGDAALQDRRAIVELGDDPVHGAAAFGSAGIERLLLRTQALEQRQQRGGC